MMISTRRKKERVIPIIWRVLADMPYHAPPLRPSTLAARIAERPPITAVSLPSDQIVDHIL
jgi:hypothetical protein